MNLASLTRKADIEKKPDVPEAEAEESMSTSRIESRTTAFV